MSYEFGTSTQGFLIDISPAANFADITTINAYRIFDGHDYIGGTAFGGDFLFAGYGGNDTLDGKGGGDSFQIPVRAGIPSLMIKGAVGAADTLFVVKNIYDTNATALDLRSSALTSIDAITLDPGAVVVIESTQLGAGISAGAVIGATSGTATIDVFKGFNGGTLDLQGKLDVNPNTTLRVFGTDTAETLSGTDRADTFYGNEGADTLNGRGGNDTFYLEGIEDAFDTINGGSGTDTVRTSGPDGFAVLNGFNAKASSIEAWFGVVMGTAEGNTFDFRGLSETSSLIAGGGDGDDTIIAPGFGFSMYGDSGDDTLVGGNGENGIAGGPGADTLTGGGAADGFVYFALADSGRKKSLRDTITDFKQGSDKIYLNKFDANAVKDGVQAFKFRGKEGKPLKKAGDLVYDQVDKKGTAKDMTIIYGDVNGDAKADMAIQLKGLVDLSKGDFLL
jgi:Ca2+-binding RTX toxin-like protein